MSRSPNSEQKLAIESTQGALLSAGAGSGKTFVIIHHILHLFEKIIKEEQNVELPPEVVEKNIARRISQIVVMTFTRKAAGEIKARIKQQIDELSVEPKWQLIQKYYEYMTVGTIDSFCAKVLRSGVIARIDNQFDIVDQELKDWELEKILKTRVKSLIERKPNLEPLILRRYNDIFSCFSAIFRDSVTRWNWEHNYKKNLDDLLDDQHYSQLLEYYDSEKFWKLSWPQELFDEHKTKKWYPQMAQIEQIKSSGASLFTKETLESVLKLLNDIARFTPPRAKKTPPEVIDFCHEFKLFRLCLTKEIGEDILATMEQLAREDSELRGWWEIFQTLFPQVLYDYEQIDGLSFSDLNITLLKNLEYEGVKNKIAEKYKYFILDEFQDTSMIQYKIVDRILDGDHNRLFAVGDPKQAIYGFRGGELNVFNQCETKASFNHSLVNNYRSLGVVTKFNNSFFKEIMGLGPKWSDIDKHQVVFEAQETPVESNLDLGKITCLKVNQPEEWDFESEFIISQLEAELFLNKILKQPAEKSLAILYSKIKLSFELIERLIQNDIGFTAQVNLVLDEEPILELLKNFLTKEKCEENQRYFNLIYTVILDRLGIIKRLSPEEAYNLFENEKAFWGLKIAFNKVLIKMGISLSKTQYNIDIFEKILDECQADEDRILAMLKLRSQGRYKMELKVGDKPERINIMTAHASKGLEFDTVLLGGIYLNGRSQPDREMVGKLPGSLKWFQGKNNQKKYRTPIFISEQIEKKEKEFSEKKRLFYVACTRAKEELVWCDFPITRVRNHENAWFSPLMKVRESFQDLITEEIFEGEVNIESQRVFKKSELPLFHRDNLGVTQRLGSGSLDFAILPEISVTKLSTVAQCPRKFYLSEVLKLDFKDLLLFKLNPESEQKEATSGVERGSLVHKEIEDFLISSKVAKSQEALWALKQLDQYPRESWDYQIEKLHKFDLFGYMMTGIPDLILTNESQLKIWDFKTGDSDPDNQKAYWFQLMLYAWYYRDKYSDIELSIIYVDEKKILSKKINKADLFSAIDDELQKMRHLFTKNEDHCQKCLFNRMCNP